MGLFRFLAVMGAIGACLLWPLPLRAEDQDPNTVSYRPGGGRGRHVKHFGNKGPSQPRGNALQMGVSKGTTPTDEEPRRLGHTPIPKARTPNERIEAFKEKMTSAVKGQPEVIDVFADIERQKMLTGPGQRKKPEIVYLAGLPGVGKDTTVEAYLDTLHGEGNGKMHLAVFPVAKSKAELWRMFGSNTGYIGSDGALPPLLKFLVEHSGGRYEISSMKDGKQFVVENPKWAPGVKIANTFQPEDAIVFFNEFHEWSREAKDNFKLAFESGVFPIHSPGPGVSEIYVPATFVMATNEGIELIAARDGFGKRVGKSLTYEELLIRWQRVHADKEAILNSIKNQDVKAVGNETIGGISEEMANRVPLRHLILMRPLSPESIRDIVALKIAKLQKKFAEAEGVFGPVNLRLDDNIAKFLATYQYNAEDGARVLDDKVEWVADTILRAVFAHGNHNMRQQDIDVSLQANPDRTYSLAFKLLTKFGDLTHFEEPISEAQHDKPVQRFSAERIEVLSSLAQKMNQRVFGIEAIAPRLQEALLVSEEENHAADKNKAGSGGTAQVFMLLGLSSTGKTETTKIFAEESPGGSRSMELFDFSSVQTVYDLKEKILGTRDMYGRPQKSKFMEHYDKYNGNVTFVFDEFANAPREVLKALYDIFREPIVTTFSDGKPRSMSAVKIFCTGNVGEEDYAGIPRDIPKFMQMFAMQEVYKGAMSNPGYRRKMLEKYFSEALINRIGENNIFFFSPLSFKAIRQLTTLKLNQALEALQASESGWGWNVAFASDADFNAFLEIAETDGFVIREQGASVDRFVKQDFARALKAKLLARQVPPGSRVAIEFKNHEDDKDDVHRRSHWSLHIEGEQVPIPFVIDGVQDNQEVPVSEETKILTAYHEVGHELVRHVLLGDKFQGKLISIVPGVACIDDRWIVYLGIAKSQQIGYADPTREKILNDLAVLLGGEAAESVVAVQYTGGKSNDISRATSLARHAVLVYGLSEAWGNFAPSNSNDLDAYIAGLSDQLRKLLEREVKVLMDEARELARATILANYETHFVPMALDLAERGQLNAEEIAKYYEEKPVKKPRRASRFSKLSSALARKIGKWLTSDADKARDADLLPSTPRPRKVADISTVISQYRSEQINSITPDVNHPVVENAAIFPSLSLAGPNSAELTCEGFFGN